MTISSFKHSIILKSTIEMIKFSLLICYLASFSTLDFIIVKQKNNMNLIINYDNISKILSNPSTYTEVTKFVVQNFSKLPVKWSIQYKDSDGDMITLASQIDFDNMIETRSLKFIKVYVIAIERSGEHPVSVQEKVKSRHQQVQRESIKEAPKEQISKQESDKIPREESEKIPSPDLLAQIEMKEWRERKGQWMKQKISKIIDERMQALMPCLTKQLQQRLRDKPEEKIQKKSSSDVIHEVECKGCKKYPIVGIRYKSTVIADFNFCEVCQEQIQHKHPMIKIKTKEDPKVQKEEQFKRFGCGFGGRGRRGHHGRSWRKNFEDAVDYKDNLPDANHPSNHHHYPQPYPHLAGFGFPGIAFPQGIPFKREKSKQCKNPDLKLTKKCFKMAERLGGQAGLYQQFVKSRLDKKVPQIIKEWAQINKLDLKKFDEQKIERKSKKLAFHYKKDASQFKEIVRSNIDCNLNELIRLIENSKMEQKKKEVIKVEEKPVNEIKKEKSIKEEKIQEKSQPVKDDIVKQQDVILTLKELFGDQNVFRYLKFYEANAHLSKEEIIENYINELNK